jgi:hypothetical protein
MLSGSVAYAGSVSTAPLAPAGAAGVKKAEMMDDRTIMLIGGGAVVIGGLVLVLSNSSGHSGSATCGGLTGISCGAGGTSSSGTGS